MKRILSIGLFVLFLLAATPVYARYDPKAEANNKYGIHIVEPNDLSDAAALVNSKGGDWGYVTLVIQEDDRDIGKWQSIFNKMRQLHLIPLVRLATHIDGDTWVKPYSDDPGDWARFLNALNWPIENRYVIIYNEPNHANEWGRTIDPEDYAHTLVKFARGLKSESEDFFVLPAGLDASAASDGRSLDEAQYLSRMLKAEPQLFDTLDGWTSHSYPNPGFSGSPYAVGRGSLRTYQWELSYLRSLGVTKDLPVFITETGWIHSQGVLQNRGLLSPEQVGGNLMVAASTVWNDPAVVAVTPFVFNYQGLPFDHFSWKKLGSNEYYPFYTSYQSLDKTKGTPRQREKYTLDHRLIPLSLVSGSTYELSALLKNEGQGIYKEGEYRLVFEPDALFFARIEPLPNMEPGQYGTVNLSIETPNAIGNREYSIVVTHNKTKTTVESGTVSIVPPPAVTLSIHLGWRTENTTKDATVLIYDGNTLLHKFEGVEFTGGKATVKGLRNIVPGAKYRVVVLVPYYLPRQTIALLKRDKTDVDIPRMLPLDFDRDGHLTLNDIASGFRFLPNDLIRLFVGL